MGTIWQPDQIDGPGPKYKAVVTMIRNGISNGALSAGEKLPPVRELAWKLGVTPGTVARAYTMLTESGTLQAEVGRGTATPVTYSIGGRQYVSIAGGAGGETPPTVWTFSLDGGN